MRHNVLSALSWRAGVAVAAVALAAGTGATTVHLVNDSHADGHPAVDASHDTTTTTGDTTTTLDDTSTTVDDHGADAATTADDDTASHPDNFGATVSEDAKDG